MFPANHGDTATFDWGDMRDIASDDTTMDSAGQAHFSRMSVLPHSQWRYDSEYGSIEEMSPYDTVRVFVQILTIIIWVIQRRCSNMSYTIVAMI